MKRSILVMAVVSACFLNLPKAACSVHINDGLKHYIVYRVNSYITVEDNAYLGTPTTVFIRPDGLIVGNVNIYDSSRVYLDGGSVERSVAAWNNSQVFIRSGSIGNRIVAGTQSIDNATITIFGGNFAINGLSAGYGEYDTGGLDWIEGTLTGTLANGDFLNNEFWIAGDSRIILAVPEPTTLLLLGLGGLLMRRRRC